MKVAMVRVVTETEERSGWAFQVEIERAEGVSSHLVRLGWADYDYWSHGMSSPARVIESLVRYLVEHKSATLSRQVFDAARARREFPEIDQMLPGML